MRKFVQERGETRTIDRIFRRIWSPALLALPLLAVLVLPSRADAQVFFSEPQIFFSQPSESPFGVGDGPAAVAIGDLNGDERPDLATANFDSDDVSVLLGDGAGGFAEATGSPVGVGDRPAEVAIGDLNRDERQDLVIANLGSVTVSVLLGDGAGGFVEATGSPFGLANNPRSIAIGDLNGDERPDLATANTGSDTVSVLLGDGAGGFAEATGSPFGVGHIPSSIVIGDLNGDERPDLATANTFSDDVSVLLGDGAGGFAEATGSPFGVGRIPISVAVGDLNGDERPDLATANQSSGDVSVLLGDGAGGFVEATGSPFGVGRSPTSVAIGDLDGDEKPDLATANPNTDDVSVLLGDGAGGFAEARLSPFAVGDRAGSVAIGDLNGDEKSDLATANPLSDDVTVLLNANPVCTITGTPEDDVLSGTPGQDVICGREGNDRLVGDRGDDVLFGEQGDDRLRGRSGDDVLEGGEAEDDLVGLFGNDFLAGGPGADRIGYSNYATGGVDLNLATGTVTNANLGTDTIAQDAGGSTVEDAAGSPFADTLRGDGQANVLRGAGGPDDLIAGAGDDLLRGMTGADELQGEGGEDALKPGAGDDPVISGGADSDTVRYDDISGGGVTVDLAAGAASPLGSDSGNDTIGADVENARGSPAGDVLRAVIAGAASVLSGGGGNDSLETADGDALDTISAGLGADSCVADGGDAQFSCP